jgi:hypothetical protein
VVIVIDVRARMLPMKEALVPIVAELPTFQYTLHACAPPMRLTTLLEPTISDEPA